MNGQGQAPLCRNIQQLGHCRFGAQCRFAQGAAGNTNGDITGPIVTQREWVWTKDDAVGQPHGCLEPFRFVFMTYNVLADTLAQDHWAELYSSVPEDAMVWERRFPRLIADIACHMPTVLNLQEVDRLEDFQRHLGPLGYDGEFVQRTGGRSDGCATFWLRDKFQAVSCERIEFRDHGLRDNVALLSVLRPRCSALSQAAAAPALNGSAASLVNGSTLPAVNGAASSEMPGDVQDGSRFAAGPPEIAGDAAAQLVVANTHILFNPARGDVKVAQCRTVLEALHRAARSGPCILAGDFNSHPGSAVHRFCRNGALRLASEDRRCMSGQKAPGSSPIKRWASAELQTALGRSSAGQDDQTVQHPLPLGSAYEAVTGLEAAFSTSHGKASAGKTVDYVWYRPQGAQWSLRAEAVLAAPHPASLQHGLPSRDLPSDHIPLVARFVLHRSAAPSLVPGGEGVLGRAG